MIEMIRFMSSDEKAAKTVGKILLTFEKSNQPFHSEIFMKSAFMHDIYEYIHVH